ncbi:hypothetical protein KC19_2G201800 [Ceratodon purpureus]|uniref:Secreted protein n=1 Tax=Ceratodon purpureus TaxID=3225 RepID=A0A8T0IZX4_CERPU|nr:hypothetical protein KC19_2G201800 [Ceratodon purpureus]
MFSWFIFTPTLFSRIRLWILLCYCQRTNKKNINFQNIQPNLERFRNKKSPALSRRSPVTLRSHL